MLAANCGLTQQNRLSLIKTVVKQCMFLLVAFLVIRDCEGAPLGLKINALLCFSLLIYC